MHPPPCTTDPLPGKPTAHRSPESLNPEDTPLDPTPSSPWAGGPSLGAHLPSPLAAGGGGGWAVRDLAAAKDPEAPLRRWEHPEHLGRGRPGLVQSPPSSAIVTLDCTPKKSGPHDPVGSLAGVCRTPEPQAPRVMGAQSRAADVCSAVHTPQPPAAPLGLAGNGVKPRQPRPRVRSQPQEPAPPGWRGQEGPGRLWLTCSPLTPKPGLLLHPLSLSGGDPREDGPCGRQSTFPRPSDVRQEQAFYWEYTEPRTPGVGWCLRPRTA